MAVIQLREACPTSPDSFTTRPASCCALAAGWWRGGRTRAAMKSTPCVCATSPRVSSQQLARAVMNVSCDCCLTLKSTAAGSSPAAAAPMNRHASRSHPPAFVTPIFTARRQGPFVETHQRHRRQLCKPSRCSSVAAGAFVCLWAAQRASSLRCSTAHAFCSGLPTLGSA